MDTQRDSNLLLFSDRERPLSGQPRSTSLSVADDLIDKKEKKRARDAAYRASHKEESAAYRAAHKEERRAYDEVYRVTHKKERRAYSAAYKATHKEQIATWYISNREKALASSSAYHAANREKVRARHTAYRATHKEERAAQNATYRASHIPEFSAHGAARRAKMRGSTIGDHAAIAEIYRKAKEDPKVRCYLCNKLIPLGDRHVDHILPVSKDGPTRPSNLGITHSKCNRSKGAKHPNELGLLI